MKSFKLYFINGNRVTRSQFLAILFTRSVGFPETTDNFVFEQFKKQKFLRQNGHLRVTFLNGHTGVMSKSIPDVPRLNLMGSIFWEVFIRMSKSFRPTKKLFLRLKISALIKKYHLNLVYCHPCNKPVITSLIQKRLVAKKSAKRNKRISA